MVSMKTISRITAATIIAVSAIALPVSANAVEVSASNLPTVTKDVMVPTGYSIDFGNWFCRTYGAWCPR